MRTGAAGDAAHRTGRRHGRRVVGCNAGRVSEDTKQRIIRATLQTLREHGAAGTSARAIAAAGDFNTSLLFYHFGSVEGALLAAAHHDTDARIARYSAHLEGLTDLSGLVRFSRQMHRENLEAGHVTALVQMLALTSTNPEIREELASVFDPWIDMVETTLDRLVGKDGIAGLSNADLAVGITSLFLGLELLTHRVPAGVDDAAKVKADADGFELNDDYKAVDVKAIEQAL